MGRFRKFGHAHLMAGAAIGVLAMAASPAWAQIKPISIQAQPLSAALHDFGAQTGRQIMFSPLATASKTTSGVDGVDDQQLALAQLLKGTGLTFRHEGDAFVIVAEASGPQSDSAAGGGAEVEALIVTAQKREEDIQDVPIAISAFTQEDLERSQIAGGPDLMTQVPNMTFTKTNFTGYSIQIRGIGTQAISATTDAAVAVAFNNTPFIRNRFFEQEFYDLQRVEVLRGPQGTLYGRNATAGVVNIISAKPVFNFEAKASGDVSNYNSTRIEGMINIPLAEDKAALRIAGAWTKRDGYVTNEISGQPIDGRDLWSTRVSLRFEPSERFSANLIWEHFEENDDRLRSGKQLCKKHVPQPIRGIPVSEDGSSAGSQASMLSQGCAPVSMYSDEAFQTPYGYALPYYGPLAQIGAPVYSDRDPYASQTQSRDLRVIESMRDPEYRAESDIVELQFAYDLTDSLTLASETAYGSDSLFSFQDFNRFNTSPGAFYPNFDNSGRPGLLDENGVFCDPQIGCSDRLVLLDLSTAESTQFSQEFRLISDYDGPFNFSLGANFLKYDTEDRYYVFANSITLHIAGQNIPVDPWIPNVSDNSECDISPFPEDPGKIYTIGGCMYIDPNPIGNLNGLGRNYFLSRNPYRLISYAAFGEAYYELNPALKITAGLRWTVDRKRAPLIPSWLFAEGGGNDYPVLEVINQTWREPTGRLTIDWKPDLSFTDDTLLYASYARGYKAGGANPPPAVTTVYTPSQFTSTFESVTHPKTFKAEYVDAFEVGTKNTLLGGRATVNLSAFYYDYTNYQISSIVDRSALNANFDAEVWGVEIEADWRPLENLRLGFKGGYQNTRVGDGEQAIDLMDRTAGDPNWVVARPFPSIPSNCILPVWFVTFDDQITLPHASSGASGPCVNAYLNKLDPLTNRPYEPYPDPSTITSGNNDGRDWTGYPGFNPLTAPNNGEGIFKQLGGNELPNAPNFTGTLTADYTVPLPRDWLMTLHGDFYYQSEAWTRIFNMEGYDKLKAYTNVNLAAIFTNEDAGWKVMAYVKNVFDRDSITGAFLNSDDTGLTTNVFLTEPRLYGVRVTKDFVGGPLLGSFGARGSGVPHLTLELGGGMARHDAPNQRFAPAFVDSFSAAVDPTAAQDIDLDWGDQRDIKLSYRPGGGVWTASVGVRTGRANGSREELRSEFGDRGCGSLPFFCESNPDFILEASNYATSTASAREAHTLVDLIVGRDVGFGGGKGMHSSVGIGLRFAELEARRSASMRGVADWDLPEELAYVFPSPHHDHSGFLNADSTFEGFGPVVAWDASAALFGDDERGHVAVDWQVGVGVLFGKQGGRVEGEALSEYFNEVLYRHPVEETVVSEERTPIDRRISKAVTVPTLNLGLGASYKVGAVKVGAGYRWERYFDAIDGGVEAPRSYDRTIDGPYFKLAVGFGG